MCKIWGDAHSLLASPVTNERAGLCSPDPLNGSIYFVGAVSIPIHILEKNNVYNDHKSEKVHC